MNYHDRKYETKMLAHIKECSEQYFTTYHLKEVIPFQEIKEARVKNKSSLFVIPGCCPQRCHPSLEDPHEELEGIFPNYYKIYGWEEDSAMDEESHNHGDHIHPKLLCNHLQVSNGDDLSTDKAGNTKR